MTMHWRMRLIQIACVLALALAVPAPEVALAAGLEPVATVVLECDPEECEEACEDNQDLCTQQGGEITEDCTGNCLQEPVECWEGSGETDCDFCLACRLPI